MSRFPRVLSRKVAGETKWLKLWTLSYLDQAGAERQWDAVHRATSPHLALRDDDQVPTTRRPDAVAILALLRSSAAAAPAVVLVRQFRPPLDAFTVELPAGLVDEGETPAEAALRELKEETGFVGQVRGSSSAPLALSPGLTSETVSMVCVDVDLQTEANAKPIAEPDEGEYVERIVVPLQDLGKELDRREATGDVVFAALRSLAVGLEMSHGNARL